jgi:hypothetical protein
VALRRPTEEVASVTDSELSRLQTALAGRLASCWDRLEDAVSELVALHDVPEAEIVARVRRAILDDQEPAEMTRAAP